MTSCSNYLGEELQHSLQELLRGFRGDAASHPCMSKGQCPPRGWGFHREGAADFP